MTAFLIWVKILIKKLEKAIKTKMFIALEEWPTIKRNMQKNNCQFGHNFCTGV